MPSPRSADEAVEWMAQCPLLAQNGACDPKRTLHFAWAAQTRL